MAAQNPDTNSTPNDPHTPSGERLLLTDTHSESETPQLQTGGPAVKFEDLGPMVVNSDGTLSRIANWSGMTEPEKERTLRVLSARNKIRLANEEQKLKDSAERQESS
ncbi:hypothetical protein B0H15DRAFT_953967 [Mycena belliarum]|uniref:Fungal specific transcription n=1 Tax=Mycena belliarum TaxID=1033014 RepID=A0AAD6TVE2_9AGAR|nr:hypothetical protein B0H15DRAFT_953967 [Mycena belliae]